VEILPVPGGHWRIKYSLPDDPPLVSLIIPTRNALPLLQRCVDGILAKTTYPQFEILIVDNESDDAATLNYLRSLADGSHRLLQPRHTARVVRYDKPFNYSAINNLAVREARGEIVGLLNNDLEVINPDWLDEMASQALRPEIGCVGAMLYYHDETIQHAGCVLGVGGVAGHAFKTFLRGDEGKFNRARLVQNYSAVTAACLVVRKSVYEQVGGLDEQALAVAFNDVDFCLKVRAAGYRNLWTPFAEFYHHESATRGDDDTSEKAGRFRFEVETMLRRWGPILRQDPAYNPNLTLEHEDFSLASPPRPAVPA
jgi:GT2 family glycosyltransferase